MNERDNELADQAGFVAYELEDHTESGYDIRYSRFADLIRADEREAVEDLLKEYDMVNSAFAKDFRARGNT